MLRSCFLRAPARRRGVILMVVLALLALFALVGITFVLYADAEATAARVAREAGSLSDPDVEPELLLACFLGQLIYDVDDSGGIYSALRGHSLARIMYGYDDEATNDTAFNGTGRLHTGPGTYMNPFALDDYLLINYTYFADDGFLRDPERLGMRSSPSQQRGPFTGGFNPSYTYPDLNNMFLAAVRADGTVLAPSFHRPWTGFGSLDPSNPNWYDTGKSWLKYQVLRPRPADMGPGFPPPESGGDVKNLVAAPGGNDSIWLDLDFPVLMAPDGRKFKPLFAPLIVDLDNRVNVNVHGNVRGSGQTHVSNQGQGPWEVNLGRVLTKGNNEWANLLVGLPAAVRLGRYGRDQQPGKAGTSSPAGLLPHMYAQVDFDACQETAGFAATSPYLLPTISFQPWISSPFYPRGYGNGSAAEQLNHPSLFNALHPAGDDRAFGQYNMEALLRPDDTGSSALISELAILCPKNSADPRIRRLVTTHSFDLNTPGTIPWLFDRDSTGYGLPLGTADQPPTGPPIPFPDLSLRTSTAIPANSDFQAPGAPPNDPRVDWRSWEGTLGRVDLNRFLPPYPHQGRGLDSATWEPTPLVGPGGRFDAAPAVTTQSLAAQAARQQLADDIYRRLLVVTSVPAPGRGPARPSDADLAPRRWLAQLAVNIVDFLDEDDISTPFQFYTSQDAANPLFDAGAVSAGNLELPRYWVFGTELPRIVLNEVLAEYQLPVPAAPGPIEIKVWAELFNPLPASPVSDAVAPLDAQPVPLYVAGVGGAPGYAPYQLVLANTNVNPGGPLLPRPGNSNVLGTPQVTQSATTAIDFATLVRAVGKPATPVPAFLAPQGFFLLGPPTADARGTIAPPLVPAATPILQSPNLTFSLLYMPPDTFVPDYRRTGITVLLRRLLNPYLPPDPRPAIAGAANPTFNPYGAIDYVQSIPLNNATPQTQVVPLVVNIPFNPADKPAPAHGSPTGLAVLRNVETSAAGIEDDAGPSNTLFFTAGLTSHFGAGTGTPHGLFGSIQAVPTMPPSTPIVPNLPDFPQQIVPTVSSLGDLNPYGVAFVSQDFQGGGKLAPGDLLVSNFNSSSNVQATGSSIVLITPDGQQSTFFQGPTGLGLTTALGVLPQGFVLVGSAPAATVNGVNTVSDGGLFILDSSGNVVMELSDSALLQGPWDLTINNVDATHAQVFVSNVLSGTGTRIDLTIPNGGTPQVESETQIASGYVHQPNGPALVVGPTGLAFDARTGTLYVASTGDNTIYAIKDADDVQTDQGKGQVVVQDPQHLHGPLALVLAPNGDLIASNGDAINGDPNHPNELVEYTPQGKFVGQFQIDGGSPGAAFGLAVQQIGDQVRFAAVDDNTNSLDIWTFQTADPPSSSGGGQGSNAGSLATPSVAMPPSPSNPLIQQIDAFFQSVNAAVQSLESSLLAMDPQLSGLFDMLNADLDAVEAMIVSKLS